MEFFEELKWRGLVKDISSPDIEKKLNTEKLCFYWGTDPTADSLHLGHYSSLVTAKRLAKAGHHPILLVGGATGLIGDPRPSAEREIIAFDTVQKNVEGIKAQVSRIVGEGVEVVNNYDWTKDFSLIDFLREEGKYINVNYMLNKDIIRRRLDTGITFAEFTYTLLQGYDFEYLYKNKNVTLQVAGSDQWGNITTGIEMVNKKYGEEIYGFTMPLILDKLGHKFGKSEGNALWLDINKTSSYELYQYLINTDDSLVIDYLKVFTFLSVDEIKEIEKKHFEKPEDRLAQKTLAHEIIKDIHGEEEYEKAINLSEALFTGDISKLSLDDIMSAFKDASINHIEGSINIVDFLVNNGVCSSKREAREMLGTNTISVNGNKVNDTEYTISKDIALHEKFVIIRRGKKKYYLFEY